MIHIEEDKRRWSFLLGLAAFVVFMLGIGVPDASADEPKRPAQDYGRPEPKTDAGDVVAWPVRIALFPFWLFHEFIIRRPIGWLVASADSGRWIDEAVGFFTFGERKQFTIMPSALFDFGLKPSVGFNATWKYLGSDDNTLDLHFGTWGVDWTVLRVTDTYALSKRERLFFDTAFWRRLDTPFSGIGPRSPQNARSRFGLETFEAAPGYQKEFGNASSFEASAGVRTLGFFDGECCGDPSLSEAVRSGRLAAPGYGDGYVAGFQRMSLALDSRRPRPEPGGGLRLEAHEQTVFPVDAAAGEPRRSWIRYGGSVGGAVDLTGHNRVLSLAVHAELVEKISSGTIPFTDRVSIGGDVLMPGYLRGRLVDDSAVVARFQYTWPVWVFLDGVIHADVGNVFGRHFAGFDPKLARLSTGIGIRGNGDRNSAFEALVAVGTDPFEDKFSVTSVRLVLGTHNGF